MPDVRSGLVGLELQRRQQERGHRTADTLQEHILYEDAKGNRLVSTHEALDGAWTWTISRLFCLH